MRCSPLGLLPRQPFFARLFGRRIDALILHRRAILARHLQRQHLAKQCHERRRVRLGLTLQIFLPANAFERGQDATALANKLVNLSIQALAILPTGGVSLLLPPKVLYVDMSAVLNGYPTGGPTSVINQAREGALNSLGVGGNNDLGNFVRGPGRIIKCPFGGC